MKVRADEQDGDTNPVPIFKHAIIAVDAKGLVLHFCGYYSEVTEADFDHLQEELDSDAEFGLIGEEFNLMKCPQEVLDLYNSEIQASYLEGSLDVRYHDEEE